MAEHMILQSKWQRVFIQPVHRCLCPQSTQIFTSCECINPVAKMGYYSPNSRNKEYTTTVETNIGYTRWKKPEERLRPAPRPIGWHGKDKSARMENEQQLPAQREDRVSVRRHFTPRGMSYTFMMMVLCVDPGPAVPEFLSSFRKLGVKE